MMDKIYQIPNERFSIDDLLVKFDTPAWNEKDTKERVKKLLQLLPDYKNDEVSSDELVLLAILWCCGDYQSKAEAFFRCLNPPGQSQEGVSANDRDWDTVFDKLVYLASIFTY